MDLSNLIIPLATKVCDNIKQTRKELQRFNVVTAEVCIIISILTTCETFIHFFLFDLTFIQDNTSTEVDKMILAVNFTERQKLSILHLKVRTLDVARDFFSLHYLNNQ